MRYLKFILVVGVLLITTSSYTTRTSGLSEGVNPGNLIPDFEIGNNSDGGFRLSALRGQKVLINLWAAYDADSHMKNVLLSNKLKKENQGLKLISISFDQSKSVFEKTLLVDGISSKFQYVDVKGSESEIYRRCQLEKGFNNYLIDEGGVIIAKNVSPSDLDELLN